VAQRGTVAAREQRRRGVLEARSWRPADGVDATVDSVEPVSSSNSMAVERGELFPRHLPMKPHPREASEVKVV
jgi:hypothetical protein